MAKHVSKYSFLSVDNIDRKTATDRLVAVRENSVSRHNGAQLRAPLKPPVHHSTIILKGLSW